VSDEKENANDSVRANCEFDSNKIDETDVHCAEHDHPMISILLEI
jgi:hypothetical protein